MPRITICPPKTSFHHEEVREKYDGLPMTVMLKDDWTLQPKRKESLLRDLKDLKFGIDPYTPWDKTRF